MLRTRIAATGASFVVLLAVTLAGAAAQVSDAGDRPLPLLQIVGQHNKEKLQPRPRLSAKREKIPHAKRRLARHVRAKTHHVADQAPKKPDAPTPAGVPAASAASADSIWPAADAAIPSAPAAPDSTRDPVTGATLAPQQPGVSV